MTEGKDVARLEGQVASMEARLSKLESGQARTEERVSTLKDRQDKSETGQRNVVMAVIGIVIAGVLKAIGFAQ